MSNSNHLAWNQDDIANWLGSLSLYHLVPNFERLQVDGSKLVTLTDTDLRNKLKIVKPAEIMAVRGAINTLIDESMKANPSGRKVSSALRPGPEPWRDRAGSYERGSKPDDGRMASKTIPRDHRNTIATDRGVMRQPKLVQGSASELVDKECKYSGWIRKQGGGYKSCEFCNLEKKNFSLPGPPPHTGDTFIKGCPMLTKHQIESMKRYGQE